MPKQTFTKHALKCEVKKKRNGSQHMSLSAYTYGHDGIIRIDCGRVWNVVSIIYCRFCVIRGIFYLDLLKSLAKVR